MMTLSYIYFWSTAPIYYSDNQYICKEVEHSPHIYTYYTEAKTDKCNGPEILYWRDNKKYPFDRTCTS